MHKVLILDANQRSALAATRSLGRRGIPVVVADEVGRTLAGASRYFQECFTYPSPSRFPQEFIDTLKKECQVRQTGVIFPMTELSMYLLLKHRDQLKDFCIPFASFQAFERLTNKWSLFELAQDIDVPIPRTLFIRGGHDFAGLDSDLNFPVVLKPHRSRIPADGRWICASVQYASSRQELEKIVATTSYLSQYPFLIQEYIPGESCGVFILYNQGKSVALFSHRRLREKPPSGGVSVLSESVKLDPKLKEIAQRILDHVGWHGVAMVEFKIAKDDTPYLIEVNARFWGSLQLAIDAGADFPYLLYQMAVGGTPDLINGYKIGLKSRWLLGDLDHLYLRLKNHSSKPGEVHLKWKAVIEFLSFFEKNVRYEVNRWDDLGPFLFELKQYLKSGIRGQGSGVRD